MCFNTVRLFFRNSHAALSVQFSASSSSSSSSSLLPPKVPRSDRAMRTHMTLAKLFVPKSSSQTSTKHAQAGQRPAELDQA